MRAVFLVILLPQFALPLSTPLPPITSSLLGDIVYKRASSLLPPSLVKSTLEAAEQFWAESKRHSTDHTYTLQYGQKEVHVSDLNPGVATSLKQHIDSVVLPSVSSSLPVPPVSPSYPLRVKDAIVIKYDAISQPNPGQPLHADMSSVSVNIALSNPDEFSGGGTFFPDLIGEEDSDPAVVTPPLAGDAIMHLSSRRHAGVGVKSGVRTILVVFIDAVGSPELRALELQAEASRLLRSDPSAALSLLNEGLSLCPSSAASLLLRSSCHLSLGNLSRAVSDCSLASSLSPRDARCLNDLGVALSSAGSPSSAVSAWSSAVELFDAYESRGVMPAPDAAAARLNLALALSYEDKYEEAVNLLVPAQRLAEVAEGVTEKVKVDIAKLLVFCKARKEE